MYVFQQPWLCFRFLEWPCCGLKTTNSVCLSSCFSEHIMNTILGLWSLSEFMLSVFCTATIFVLTPDATSDHAVSEGCQLVGQIHDGQL